MAPLDALTGLVMLTQACDEDMVWMRFVSNADSARPASPQLTCMYHAVVMADFMRHSTAVKPLGDERLGPVDYMIARDDLIDNVRKGIWMVYAVRKQYPGGAHCVACGPR